MTTIDRVATTDATSGINQSHRDSTLAAAAAALVALLIVTVCSALMLYGSLTPEQRIAVFTQWQMFP